MVSVTVYILYRLIHLFVIVILASTVLSLPLHAIWIGIVTMQLGERYGKELGNKHEWTFWNWRCRAGAAKLELGLGL